MDRKNIKPLKFLKSKGKTLKRLAFKRNSKDDFVKFVKRLAKKRKQKQEKTLLAMIKSQESDMTIKELEVILKKLEEKTGVVPMITLSVIHGTNDDDEYDGNIEDAELDLCDSLVYFKAIYPNHCMLYANIWLDWYGIWTVTELKKLDKNKQDENSDAWMLTPNEVQYANQLSSTSESLSQVDMPERLKKLIEEFMALNPREGFLEAADKLINHYKDLENYNSDCNLEVRKPEEERWGIAYDRWDIKIKRRITFQFQNESLSEHLKTKVFDFDILMVEEKYQYTIVLNDLHYRRAHPTRSKTTNIYLNKVYKADSDDYYLSVVFE